MNVYIHDKFISPNGVDIDVSFINGIIGKDAKTINNNFVFWFKPTL